MLTRAGIFLSLFLIGSLMTSGQTTGSMKSYLFYVLSESADKISLVRFGPHGATIERSIDTGSMPTDIDGPHGISISRDKRFYYVSLANGRPFGSVWKYDAATNAVLGRAQLGYFPATMDLSRDGELLFVVNFNLHGDMVPSSVSVVATAAMMEVARIPTCTMPHGSRLNSQGTKHYSVCMMDDMLVEIDTATLKVSRHFLLTKGRETGRNGSPSVSARNSPTPEPKHQHDTGGHGMEPPKAGDVSCRPTWAQPSVDGSSVFVACNSSNEIVEIDVGGWKVKRRLAGRDGAYNLAVTKSGRLIATNKRDQSVSIVELATGRELARLTTKRKVLHGVVVSPDDRYAFVSVEGIGSEPGTVEIVDLDTLKIVASVDVPQEAAGIDFFRIEQTKQN